MQIDYDDTRYTEAAMQAVKIDPTKQVYPKVLQNRQSEQDSFFDSDVLELIRKSKDKEKINAILRLVLA